VSRLRVALVSLCPALGVAGGWAAADSQETVILAGVCVLVVSVAGLVLLLGVVLPAVWSRRSWRRRAAVAVLRVLGGGRERGG
jgi:hypothetical protein